MLTPFDLELFVAIADTGSLTAAARACGLTRATVTRRLTMLQERLGVPLLHRTTRDLALTEAGLLYLEGCRETLTRLRQVEANVHQLGGAPRGQLRIACPIIGVEQIVGPLVTAFAREYPDVAVQLHLSSETCNPLVDGFDIAVQMGLEQNSALASQCLVRDHYALIASPGYLERRGVPRTVDELEGHDCIVAVRANGAHEPWPVRGGGLFTVAKPKLLVNAAGLVRVAALHGLGIALIAQTLVREDLAAGTLVRVLEDRVGRPMPIYLVYAAGSKLSPKIRCFIDYAAAWLARLRPEAAASAPVLIERRTG
jgi:DNA-binding transcriptional LysR family regulator